MMPTSEEPTVRTPPNGGAQPPALQPRDPREEATGRPAGRESDERTLTLQVAEESEESIVATEDLLGRLLQVPKEKPAAE
jgi:hypothetical protein